MIILKHIKRSTGSKGEEMNIKLLIIFVVRALTQSLVVISEVK